MENPQVLVALLKIRRGSQRLLAVKYGVQASTTCDNGNCIKPEHVIAQVDKPLSNNLKIRRIVYKPKSYVKPNKKLQRKVKTAMRAATLSNDITEVRPWIVVLFLNKP